MTGKELADYLSSVKPYVSSAVQAKLRQVIRLAYSYKYLEAKFTFDKDADLDKQVNTLLLAMSDEVLEYIYSRSSQADSDNDGIIPYIQRQQGDKTLVERVDSYSSHAKYLLEGYVAVCFYNGWSLGRALASLQLYLSAPYSFGKMREAFSKPQEFDSAIIRARGYHFGSGIATNPVAGLALTAQVAINEAMQYAEVSRYKRDGRIIGYRVHRGSSYDCDLCDSLCVGIHPLDDIVIPSHPRCCCYMTPVYEGETT